MINVFFVTGMFGSTVEYVLRSFTKEYENISIKSVVIRDDGSMHSYRKQFHPCTLDELVKSVDADISTPIYPIEECHLPEILEAFQHQVAFGKSILIHANSLQSAEINMLFQYYKIATKHKDLGVFCGNNTHNIINWNKNYQHWTQMQVWELREWLSLFYTAWVQEWIDSQYQVPTTFLKIQNTDLLYNTATTLNNIIDFAGLTIDKPMDDFVLKWQQKQQYVVDEFDTLNQILINTLNQKDYEWKPVCIISEAIIQQRLRSNGFEIRCDGLNTFPTNAKTLYSLLEKC